MGTQNTGHLYAEEMCRLAECGLGHDASWIVGLIIIGAVFYFFVKGGNT